MGGVKLLLDTHTLLWALCEPGKLSSGVRQLLENPKNTRLVSTASLWEIAIKHKLGRLALGGISSKITAPICACSWQMSYVSRALTGWSPHSFPPTIKTPLIAFWQPKARLKRHFF